MSFPADMDDGNGEPVPADNPAPESADEFAPLDRTLPLLACLKIMNKPVRLVRHGAPWAVMMSPEQEENETRIH